MAIEEYTPDVGFGSTDDVYECEVATIEEQMPGGDDQGTFNVRGGV